MTSLDQLEQQLIHGVHKDDDGPERRSMSGSEGSNDEVDEEDNDRLSSSDFDVDEGKLHQANAQQQGARSSYNTGPKGVRNDAALHAEGQKALRRDRVEATNKQMESMALGKNRTWEEDERDRRREAEQGLKPGQTARLGSERKGENDDDLDDDDDELKMIRTKRLAVLKSQDASNEARKQKMLGAESDGPDARGSSPTRTFGHLREVDADHYAHAIDGEDPSVFVVVHIYVKYVHACAQVTSALSTLARTNMHVKFIQVRAGEIGFGSGGKEVADDLEADEEADEVVPTLLVYKAGQLVANLVRIDLEEEFKSGEEQNLRTILRLQSVPV